MITPASTNEKVTAVGDYIFRVCFIDPFQGEVLAKFAYNDLKARRVAILTDIRQDYSVGLTDAVTEHFNKAGGTVLAAGQLQLGRRGLPRGADADSQPEARRDFRAPATTRRPPSSSVRRVSSA